MYVNQSIMPYTSNLYNVVRQLYLSKTGRKKKISTYRLIYKEKESSVWECS